MHLAVLADATEPAGMRAVLRQARDVGFQDVQLGVCYQADQREWEDLAAELRRLGLRPIAVGGYTNPLHPEATERGSGMAILRAAIERAAILECEVVVTWSGSRNASLYQGHPDNASAVVWDEAVDIFGEAARSAEAAGVNVAIEPFHNHLASTPDRLRALLTAVGSSSLGAVMDPPNFLGDGEIEQINDRMPAMFAALAPTLVLAHAKDIRRPRPDETRLVNSGVALPHAGGGVMDYALYARLLRQHYDGPVVVEHVTAETLAAAHDHVARHIGLANGGGEGAGP